MTLPGRAQGVVRGLVVSSALVVALCSPAAAFAGMTTVEENTAAVSYAPSIAQWTLLSGPTTEYSGGTSRYTTVAPSSFTFTFTGTGVDWVAAKSTSQHTASVSLDGVPQGTVNLNQPIRQTKQTIWGIRGLANTSHTLVVTTVLPYSNVDAFYVYTPSNVVATPGANGSISPAGTTAVDYNQSQLFTITPASGYHVEDVVVNGASVGAVTSYTMNNVTANGTISATFAENPVTSSNASAGWSLAVGAALALLGVVVVRKRRQASAS